LKLDDTDPINIIVRSFRIMAKPPHPGDLIATIRRLAVSGAYSFSRHAFEERMLERGFDVDDVLKIVALGGIVGPVVAGRRRGEWTCTVVGRLPWTSREAGVVTVVVRESRLIFITVEWMDP
jgi:hypothetical protein